MKKVSLAATLRADTGKRATKALRRAGEVPVAVYGPSLKESRSLSVNARDLQTLIRSTSNSLINLEIPGEEPIQTLLKAHESDPVMGWCVHADFYQVADNHLLRTSIPVEVEGSSEGVRAGGVLERNIREIEIECFPRDLPEHFAVDISALQIGDSVHVRDLTLPPGVTVLSPEPNVTLVQVIEPRVIEEPVAAEGEELAEGEEPAEGAEGAEDAPKDGGADKKDKKKEGAGD